MRLILIVGHENQKSRLLQSHLEFAGYVVRVALLSANVIRQAEEMRPVLIVIDADAAGKRTEDLCRRMRRIAALEATQFMLVAADASEEQRVMGLEAGADDYLAGTFSPSEFMARVSAVLRRIERSRGVRSAGCAAQAAFLRELPAHFSVGDIELDTSAMRVIVRGIEVPVTTLEFRLILFLAKNQPRVFTRDQLLDAVWGSGQFITPRSVDACVRRVREKIEPDSTRPFYLKTVRGVGYRLNVMRTDVVAPEQADDELVAASARRSQVA